MGGNPQGWFGGRNGGLPRFERGFWRLRGGGWRFLRLGGRRGRDFVTGGHSRPVDAVGPVQHGLQHGLRLRRRRAHAQQRLAHGFQAVGGVEQGIGQRPVGQRTVLGECLQDIFHVVGQSGDATHSDGVAGALQGMGDASRHFHVGELAIAGGQPLNGGGKVGGLLG